MSLIIDIILILVAIYSVFKGVRRGFIRSVMHLLSIVIALVLVVLLRAPVSEQLYDGFFLDVMASPVEEELLEIKNTSTAADVNGNFGKVGDLIAGYPEPLRDVVERYGLSLENIVSVENGSSYEEGVSNLAERIASPVAELTSNVVAAILIFAVALALLKLLTFLIDKLFKLPVLKGFNTLFGLLFGIVSAGACIWFIAVIAVMLVRALSPIGTGFINEGILDSSVIISFLMKNGIVK